MVLTTTPDSITMGLSPRRCADTAAARPHGPAPTITRSASFDISPARRSGYADRASRQRALDADDLIAPRSNADVRDLGLDQRLNAVEVSPRLRRQIGQAPRVGGGRHPAVEPLVSWHRALQQIKITRKLLVHLAVRGVAGAEADAIDRVEHVELGDREIGEPVDPRGVADDDAIEPAAAPRPACRRAELVSELANARSQNLLELGGQGSVAHPRRVSLHHADYRIELTRRDADAGGGTARRRAARCHVRVRAVIDVEQRALRSLEEHRGAADDGAMDLEADVFSERQQSIPELLQDAQ